MKHRFRTLFVIVVCIVSVLAMFSFIVHPLLMRSNVNYIEGIVHPDDLYRPLASNELKRQQIQRIRMQFSVSYPGTYALSLVGQNRECGFKKNNGDLSFRFSVLQQGNSVIAAEKSLDMPEVSFVGDNFVGVVIHKIMVPEEMSVRENTHIKIEIQQHDFSFWNDCGPLSIRFARYATH